MMRSAIQGQDLKTAAAGCLELIKTKSHSEETVRALKNALCIGAENIRAGELGEGWIAEEALAIGLSVALAGKDFPEVLRLAANHRGDSDSTASLAGQLYGAWRGVSGLPNCWVRVPDVLYPMLSLVNELLRWASRQDSAAV